MRSSTASRGRSRWDGRRHFEAQVHRESLWLDQWALETERWINNWMLENFDDEYDETVRFIVRRGNIDANDIVRDVLAMMPGLE